jgi:O-antigen/teichoic acid export membrane protein
MVMNLFVATFSKDIVFLIGGDKYIEYYYLIYFFLILNMFIFLSRILENNIHLSKQSKYGTYTEVVSGVLNIVFNIYFITYFGLIGALYATLLAYFIRLSMYNYFAKKLFDKFHIEYKYYFYYFSYSIILFYLLYIAQDIVQIYYKIILFFISLLGVAIYFYLASDDNIKVNIKNKIKGFYNADK